ncbi:MAG: amino acid ABC transporter permease [Clostridiales Family XIII bacterium]|jgi:L-cystine transport system permease protein|nr:amino acid ABC transporter permease [Clostridiales Family XIII bacterium]
MDVRFMLQSFPKILAALPLTLAITLLSMVVGLLLGLLFTFAKISRWMLVRGFAFAFTTLVRGIPTVVLLFLSYFGLPALFAIFGVNINGWDRILFAVIALVLEISAVASELFRSAWLSVNRGQLDAAYSIGMNHAQTFSRVIAPQVLRVIAPNLANLTIAQFQNTSLVYTLGVIDIVGKVNILSDAVFGIKTLELYLTAALIYWGVCVLFSCGFHLLEQRLNRGVVLAR